MVLTEERQKEVRMHTDTVVVSGPRRLRYVPMRRMGLWTAISNTISVLLNKRIFKFFSLFPGADKINDHGARLVVPKVVNGVC